MFALLFLAAFFLVKPFFTPIATALITAYMFYPLYRLVKKLIKSRTLSAIVVSAFIIALIIIPTYFILTAISKEAVAGYEAVKEKIEKDEFLGLDCTREKNVVCNTYNFIKDPSVQKYVESSLGKIQTYIVTGTTSFIFSIPRRLLDVFITFFVIFYMLKDGPKLVKKIEGLLPLGKKHKSDIGFRIRDVMYAIVYGNILTALIQGTIAGIGYWIFKVHSPILWALITALFAVVPFLGTAVVWIPISLSLIFTGLYSNQQSLVWNGIGLMIYCALLVSTIDNIVKPKIISGRADVHPLLVLIGVVGGLAVFGVIGIFIGPLILALLVTFIKIYEEGFY